MHHRTIYRHNAGYSFRPAVASLTRHAAWRAWAAGRAARPMPQVLAQQLAFSEELFYLWRCEKIGAPEPPPLPSADPWEGEYPTLFFLTSALRGSLKIGLNRKP